MKSFLTSKATASKEKPANSDKKRHHKSTLLHYRPQLNPGQAFPQQTSQNQLSQGVRLLGPALPSCPNYEEALKSLKENTSRPQKSCTKTFVPQETFIRARRASLQDEQFSQRYRSYSGHSSCPSPNLTLKKSSFIPLEDKNSHLDKASLKVEPSSSAHDFSKKNAHHSNVLNDDLPLDLRHPSKRPKLDFVVGKDGILDFSSKTRHAIQEMKGKTEPQLLDFRSSGGSSKQFQSKISGPTRESCVAAGRLRPKPYEVSSRFYDQNYDHKVNYSSWQQRSSHPNHYSPKQNENEPKFIMNPQGNYRESRYPMKDKFIETAPSSSQVPGSSRYLSNMNREVLPSMTESNFDDMMMSRCISKAKDALLKESASSRSRAPYQSPSQKSIDTSAHASSSVYYCREVNINRPEPSSSFIEKPIQYLNTNKDEGML